MYYVYALYNKNRDKLYIGQTDNLEERIKLHKDKTFAESFTAKNSGEWILIYSEKCKSRQTALKREKQLKSYRGREFIKKHIPR